jgi:hypothetical protein
MSTNRMEGLRALAAVLLLAVILGAISRVSAQEVNDTANESSTPAAYGTQLDGETLDSSQFTGDELSDLDESEVAGTPGAQPEDPGDTTSSGDGNTSVEPPATPESEPYIDDGGVAFTTSDIEDDIAVEQQPAELAPNVTIVIAAFDCDVDPGSSDPATSSDCAPSAGVDIAVAIDGVASGVQTTDLNGTIAISVPDASAIDLVEDPMTIPSGYHAVGNGDAHIPASDGATVTFIHLAQAVAGRLQIVNGSCPTSGDSRTEFRIIEPRSVAEASTPACLVTNGALFTITGGPLGAGAITVTTGSDGAWRGYLIPGDYTVFDDSGASGLVTVVADDVSVAIVVDYVSAPLGVLNVSRFSCTEGDQTKTVISFQSGEPTVGDDDNCDLTDGELSIDVLEEVSAESVTTFDLGPDGSGEIELPGGSYVLTDLLTGESASFTLHAGSRLYAVVQELKISNDGVGGSDPGVTPKPTKTPRPGGDGTGGDGDGDGDPTPAPNNPGDGSGAPSGGDDVGSDGSSGPVDNGADGKEIAGVTTLPSAGAYDRGGDESQIFLLMALLTLAFGIAGVGGVHVLARRAK